MPISDGEWKSIRTLVDSLVSKKGEYFVTGDVIKRDEDNKLVWIAEFGDQPIPLVAFDYRIKYYDADTLTAVDFAGSTVTAKTTTTRKYATSEVLVPEIGDTVIVARELGVNRIPRCLGILKGKNWIDTTEG